MSALEMACCDIITKDLDQPVYNLLGGQVNEKLRSYSYLYPKETDTKDVYEDPDFAAERAAKYVEWGFNRSQVRPDGALHDLRRPAAVAGADRARS